MLLKADLHSHTSDDPIDEIAHSAEQLIDRVAEKGVHVLAITCHAALVHDEYLLEYARQKGITLIPGMEADIEQRHVLILNPHPDHLTVSTFDELREIGKQDAVIIAPHPYYPGGSSLMGKLEANIDLFDAIEYCNFYLPFLNIFNWQASRIARRYKLPMVGSSDTHVMPYEDSTFTWIDAEPDLTSILNAIRNGHVQVESRPRPLVHVANMLLYAFGQARRDHIKKRPLKESSI